MRLRYNSNDQDKIQNSLVLRSSPERKLLGAVLERAIRDYVGQDDNQAKQARAWIFEQHIDPMVHDEFSFSWICEQLELNQRLVAAQLKKLRRLVRRKGIQPTQILTRRRAA